MIEHVFVLMLENRSFDHMLGLAGIRGIDAATGEQRAVDGLGGNEFNRLPSGAEIAVGKTELKPGDQVLAILQPGKEDELRQILLKK